jgi:beta-galactosidase
MPGENGSEKLATVLYDKGSVWNTYQDVTVRLPRRIRGVATLCLVFREKVHVKGFCFTRIEKAFAKLNAADNDGINGDSFTVHGGEVTGIGNNVSIVYTNMDFGDKGTESVTLSARSPLKTNSVQLLIGDKREMLEVAGTERYTESSYALKNRYTGRQTVTFVFLPGCQIDLEWIKFKEAGQ